jgi:hypothetical protein
VLASATTGAAGGGELAGLLAAADEARGPAPEPFTWNGTQPA